MHRFIRILESDNRSEIYMILIRGARWLVVAFNVEILN